MPGGTTEGLQQPDEILAGLDHLFAFDGPGSKHYPSCVSHGKIADLWDAGRISDDDLNSLRELRRRIEDDEAVASDPDLLYVWLHTFAQLADFAEGGDFDD